MPAEPRQAGMTWLERTIHEGWPCTICREGLLMGKPSAHPRDEASAPVGGDNL